MRRKTERNQRLKDFIRKHPDMSMRNVAKVFHLSHVRVMQILSQGSPVNLDGGENQKSGSPKEE